MSVVVIVVVTCTGTGEDLQLFKKKKKTKKTYKPPVIDHAIVPPLEPAAVAVQHAACVAATMGTAECNRLSPPPLPRLATGRPPTRRRRQQRPPFPAAYCFFLATSAFGMRPGTAASCVSIHFFPWE